MLIYFFIQQVKYLFFTRHCPRIKVTRWIKHSRWNICTEMLQKTPDRIKRNKMEENLNEKLGLDKGPYWGPFLHRSHCGTNLKSCTVYRKMKHNTRSCTTYLGPFCLRRVYKKLIGWSLMVRKDQQGYAQAGWWGVLKGGIMSFPTASRSPWRWKVLSRSDSLVLIHWTVMTQPWMATT